MYAMYPEPTRSTFPEWGPAAHDPENPRSRENVTAAVQRALDLRDNGGQLHDDN